MIAPKLQKYVLQLIFDVQSKKLDQVNYEIQPAVDQVINQKSTEAMMTDYIQRLRQLQGVIWHGLYSSEATVISTASAIEQLCLADDPIV